VPFFLSENCFDQLQVREPTQRRSRLDGGILAEENVRDLAFADGLHTLWRFEKTPFSRYVGTTAPMLHVDQEYANCFIAQHDPYVSCFPRAKTPANMYGRVDAKFEICIAGSAGVHVEGPWVRIIYIHDQSGE
jgi:hypothetical protein